MALAARKSDPTTHDDVKAIVTGQYKGDAQALIRNMVRSMVAELNRQVPGAIGKSNQAVVIDLFSRKLVSLMLPIAYMSERRPKTGTLPVAMLSPAEVVARQDLNALTTLYRYDKLGKVYCVKPKGRSNGRVFPAWQFVDPVPKLLPDVIAALRGVLHFEIHAFFVTQLDELNELSPAEVLAGIPFETRTHLPPAQARILALPAAERLARVTRLASEASEGVYD